MIDCTVHPRGSARFPGRISFMFGRNPSTRATTVSADIAERTVCSRFECLAKPARTLAMVAISVLLSSIAPQGLRAADPDHVFANCTFTISGLQAALTISDPDLSTATLEASYILIYVRTNPNDGQQIGITSTYTGPVLCHNSASESVVPTTEATSIPNTTNHGSATSVDILDSEEAFHLRYHLNGGSGATEKRVCHTVAGNTDCFFIQPLSID